MAVSFPGEHRAFVWEVVQRLAEVLGRDLALIFDGDVRQRDLFAFAEADAEAALQTPSGTAGQTS
jgi:hypothetical protein